MDGCVSIGGVKIDDGVSYCAAACWAGAIDNEIHVNFPFALGERRTLKRVRKDCDVARTHGHLAMASQSSSTAQTLSCNLSTPSGQISTSCPQVTHSLKLRRTTEFFKIEMGHSPCQRMERAQCQTAKLRTVSVGRHQRRPGMRYPKWIKRTGWGSPGRFGAGH